jgi:brefeldin A-inhibited guanine nucleotide-exchange protein
MASDDQEQPMEDVELDAAPAVEPSPPPASEADATPQPAQQPFPKRTSSLAGESLSVELDSEATPPPPPPPPPKETAPVEPIAPLGVEVVGSTEAAALPLTDTSVKQAAEAPAAPEKPVVETPPPPPAPARKESVSSEASSRPAASRGPSALDRSRTGSTSTISSIPASSSLHHHRGSLSTLPATTLSSIHLVTALNQIGASKEARRSPPLQKAITAALEALKQVESTEEPIDQALILEPLRLACETRSSVLQSTALDCISKLVSHSFFHAGPVGVLPSDAADDTAAAEVPRAQDTVTVSDHLVAIITSTYTSDGTPDAVALQIVKSLLALVLSPQTPVHHSSLLKAVRTVYNIFLLSSDPVNQMVAQGGLTQMVHHVFGRVRVESGQLGVDAAARSPLHSRKDSSATIGTLNGAGSSGRATPVVETGLGPSTVSLSLDGARDEPSLRSSTPIVRDRELQEGLRQPVGESAPPPVDRSNGVTSPLGHSNPPTIILCGFSRSPF